VGGRGMREWNKIKQTVDKQACVSIFSKDLLSEI
jgi:hypothetical protein